jgi:glycosyltransferase involved in cell wall biosynthesis
LAGLSRKANSVGPEAQTEPTKPRITAILTQYKRGHLEKQLKAINSQTKKPDRIIVFQNESHVDIESLRNLYNFELVRSDHNTKYFGRFAYCLALESDFFMVLDDDIIPGPRCFEVYLRECERLNAIIGANGRIAQLNPHAASLCHPPDTGIRNNSVLVDFVGHMWVFRKTWLFDMFSIPPKTLTTGEDMHLCFSAKIRSGIPSYVCRQADALELSDITNNKLAIDKFSSFKSTPEETRIDIERYFMGLGLDFIKTNAETA